MEASEAQGEGVSRDALLERFDAAIKGIDRVSATVLQGHLLLENRLESLITTPLIDPSYVQEARLSFHQKMSLARSLSHNYEDSTWVLLAALNALQNDVAHRLDSPRREDLLRRVREAQTKADGQDDSGDDVMLITTSVSFCLGFLAAVEEDIAARAEAFKQP